MIKGKDVQTDITSEIKAKPPIANAMYDQKDRDTRQVGHIRTSISAQNTNAKRKKETLETTLNTRLTPYCFATGTS
jgi:phosphoribosylaminoimidazole carboxylase (NCAIR synthetase)